MGYFVIDRDKEYIDTLTLIKKIKDSEWVDSNTIIVVCSPEYSSQLCQIINHSLSHLNNNEPFEMEFLEMPYPNEERLNKSEYSMLCEELSEKYRGIWMQGSEATLKSALGDIINAITSEKVKVY